MLNRDVLYIEEKDIVIATDNCGCVGSKLYDKVKINEEFVAYCTTKVVLMEILSVGSIPFSCSIQIFDNKLFDKFLKGVKNAFNDAKIKNYKIISTTESNFEMLQTAFAITIIGTGIKKFDINKNLKFAVIGKPLVGYEVIENKDDIVTLHLFKNIIEDKKIEYTLPVGSSGINYEIESNFNKKVLNSKVDIYKSSGPSTCIIVLYKKENENFLENKYKQLFEKLEVL